MTSSPNNKIYFSGSLQGIRHCDPNFSWELVQFMKKLGFEVLSEHVAAKTQKEGEDIFFMKTNIDRRKLDKAWFSTFDVDMGWVDKANYLVAVVDGPSHGVGMEIMRALLKGERGLNITNILCLVNENNLEKLSWMIRGISKQKYPNFSLKTYTDLLSAKNLVKKFLETH